MANIELVIKIPEEIYNSACTANNIWDMRMAGFVCSAIANGTLLPKGHGKLIDVKDLLKLLCLADTEQNRKLNMGEHITLEDIDCIEPIIEADCEEM